MRTIVPYTRVPGLLLMCAAAFTLPFLVIIVVTANAIVGNIWILVGFWFFLGALILVYIPWELFSGMGFKEEWTLMRPSSYESASRGHQYRKYLTFVLYALGGLFVAFGFFVIALGLATPEKLTVFSFKAVEAVAQFVRRNLGGLLVSLKFIIFNLSCPCGLSRSSRGLSALIG